MPLKIEMMTAHHPIKQFALGIFILLSLYACQNNQAKESQGNATTFAKTVPPEKIEPRTHLELKEIFFSHNYDLDTVPDGVPPLILEALPKDLNRIAQINERKRIFFLSLLPLVLMANEEIRESRDTMLELFDAYDRGESLAENQIVLVRKTALEYKVDGDPLTEAKARIKLFNRLDIVPPSMALAQAATESAYGTSRFARKANNLFGEWTFIPGTGLVPEGRPEGETYEVRRFPSLYDSVKSYMKNINTHWAYHTLREKRARLRNLEQPLRGAELAQGLRLYSTRREAYVEDIRAIISRNRLSRFSSASLRTEETAGSKFQTPPPGAGLLSTRERCSRIHALTLARTNLEASR